MVEGWWAGLEWVRYRWGPGRWGINVIGPQRIWGRGGLSVRLRDECRIGGGDAGTSWAGGAEFRERTRGGGWFKSEKDAKEGDGERDQNGVQTIRMT